MELNEKGGMEDAVSALAGLFVALIMLYVVMIIWQPVAVDLLFPILNNGDAFTYGSTAVTLLQALILVIVAALFIAFFNEIRGDRRPPTIYG